MHYFVADLHFCHAKIISLCNRPFNDVNEMNNRLIRNWNSIVSNNDDIYILGDFAFRGSGGEILKIAKRLKGRKYLIRGNHEKYLTDANFDVSVFEWIKDYFVLNYEDARFVLFHYPILEWQDYHRKSAHLYGHIHNNTSHIPDHSVKFACMGNRAINVGVDCNNFFPVSAKEVYEKAFKDWGSDCLLI
ncbi:MAG: metallophosphoesterase [Oscillospiraceae bacterium]|nr:metallophosphoesterase [Oscillospiraceae bacterium]